jgi:hypothetical protein
MSPLRLVYYAHPGNARCGYWRWTEPSTPVMSDTPKKRRRVAPVTDVITLKKGEEMCFDAVAPTGPVPVPLPGATCPTCLRKMPSKAAQRQAAWRARKRV